MNFNLENIQMILIGVTVGGGKFKYKLLMKDNVAPFKKNPEYNGKTPSNRNTLKNKLPFISNKILMFSAGVILIINALFTIIPYILNMIWQFMLSSGLINFFI